MGFLALLIVWAGTLYVLFELTSLLWLFGACAVIGAAGFASAKIGENALAQILVWIGAFVFMYVASGLLAFIGVCAVMVAGAYATVRLCNSN